MLTRQDTILLLTDLQDKGINIDTVLTETLNSDKVLLSTIEFINNNRELDITNFYKYIRKSYNIKKSKLYKNIVNYDKNINDCLTTLSALSLQIFLYSKKLTDKQMFYKHARLYEIEFCLADYAKTYDLSKCLKLLELIKADLKALESITK